MVLNQNQLLVAALVVAVIVIWLTILSFYLLRVVKAKSAAIQALAANKDLADVITELLNEVSLLNHKYNKIALTTKDQRKLLAETIKHVGLVRFDAFEDVGGQLSFSAALLNEKGDGIVITSINGRSDTRVYAKTITGGKAQVSLSAEEVEAIKNSNWGAA